MLNAVFNLLYKVSPDWLYQRLIGDWNSAGFKKYFNNTAWIFLARLFSYAVSFFTIAIVARYLGPENFGKLSYAQSFVAIFSVFASLGIDQVLYRELVTAKPEERNRWLGTAFVIKLVCGLLTILVTVLVAVLVNDDPVLTWLICIISLSFIFQPFGVISHYFNAIVRSKYTAGAGMVVAFLIPLLKLVVIFFDKGILYLASLIVLEAILLAVFYTSVYVLVFKASIFSWRFSPSTFVQLMNDAWPLMFASLSGYIYGRIDQVMIQHFMDSTAVGLYDAAVRVTEILGFLPIIIITSVFPAIVNAKRQGGTEYRKRFLALSGLCLSISLVLALLVFFASPLIVKVLFGVDFSVTSSLLRLYVWATVGTVAVILMQNYFIAENMSRHFLIFSFLGAGVNASLNFYLIPIFGIYGAAGATLLTFGLILSVFVMVQHNLFKRQ